MPEWLGAVAVSVICALAAAYLLFVAVLWRAYLRARGLIAWVFFSRGLVPVSRARLRLVLGADAGPLLEWLPALELSGVVEVRPLYPGGPRVYWPGRRLLRRGR